MKVMIGLDDALIVSLCWTAVQLLNGVIGGIPWVEVFVAVYWIWATAFGLLLVAWRPQHRAPTNQ